MMHQPSGGIGGTASDIKILAEQIIATKKELNELNAQHTGKSVEQIEADSDRDRWFTAKEALEYGFIDHVFTAPQRSSRPTRRTSEEPFRDQRLHSPTLPGGLAPTGPMADYFIPQWRSAPATVCGG